MSIKHLTIRTENELGGTRYHGICGASGLSSRDYSQNVTRTTKGVTVQVVTCIKCLSKAKKGQRK